MNEDIIKILLALEGYTYYYNSFQGVKCCYCQSATETDYASCKAEEKHYFVSGPGQPKQFVEVCHKHYPNAMTWGTWKEFTV